MTSATAYMLYFLFAMGGAGVFLLMPKAERRTSMPGAIIGGLAAVALLAFLGFRIIVPDSTTAYFYLFSTIALVGAVRVITHVKPVYSALYFVLVVIAVAALLVLLQAEFLAVALIIIYAGAILVTYLFVIMLAQQSGSPVYDRRAREPFWAVTAGFVLMAAVAGRAGDLSETTAGVVSLAQAQEALDLDSSIQTIGHSQAIGNMVMTRHVVALEVAGVLLLVSMIGALAMSKKKVPGDGFSPPAKPIGQIGREVEPY